MIKFDSFLAEFIQTTSKKTRQLKMCTLSSVLSWKKNL